MALRGCHDEKKTQSVEQDNTNVEISGETANLIRSTTNVKYGKCETSIAVETEENNEAVSVPSRPLTLNDKLMIAVMCAANFFCFANFSIPAPIFPPAAERKGMSKATVGFVIGLFNLIMFLVSPIIGSIITKVGAKFLFVSGTFVGAVCGALFGSLEYGPPGDSYTALTFLTRGLQAVSSAAFQTASYTIISFKFPEKVTTYFSFLETFVGLGIMTGPPISGILFEAGGYYLPFIVSGICLFLTGIIILFTLPTITDQRVQENRFVGYFITRPGSIVGFYTLFTMSFSVTFLEPTFADYLAVYNLQPYQIGFMFLIMPALYAICGPIIGHICDRNGYIMTMMITGSIVAGIAFMFFAPAPFFNIQPKLWLLITANVIAGLFLGTCFVPVFPVLIITAYEYGYPDNLETNGMVSGFLISAFSFGGFAGASSAGLMVEQLGFRMTVFIVGILYLSNAVSLIIFALVRRRKFPNGDIFDKQRALLNVAVQSE